jgi:cytochrome o ubiquinol oxidase subunit 1
VFWCWLVGFWLAFAPLYMLGLMGATRRMQHYADPGWQPLMVVALVGALVILTGIVLTAVQLVVSVRARERLRDVDGDPWDGRTLEWATHSPPPPWNFARLPQVCGLDDFWAAKQTRGGALVLAEDDGLHRLEMPRPSAIGVVLAFFVFVAGFALVWHIFWLAGVALACVLAACLLRAWRTDVEFEVSDESLAALDPRGAAA